MISSKYKMIYPWQEIEWQRFLNYKNAKKIPHAILLSGIRGLGKAHFAQAMAQELLCLKNTNGFCDNCHACHLIKEGSHPNLLWLEPEKPGQDIKIDDIRKASEFIAQTGLAGEFQIIILNTANALNMHAANALLKTLEEPPTNSLLILINDQSTRLPATIRSRCQKIQFVTPVTQSAVDWIKNQEETPGYRGQAAVRQPLIDTHLALNLAHGAPLAALQLMQDETELSIRQAFYDQLIERKNASNLLKRCEAMKDVELQISLDLFINWLLDILRLQTNEHAYIINSDYSLHLQNEARLIEPRYLANFLNYVLQLRKQYFNGINFNKQMLLENLLLKWLKPHER